MHPLVSILIPAYNAGKWIADAIESAVGQTWPKKEIIIIDDGSSDDTLQIAGKYESKIVKVSRQENKGASAARNKALSFAQGDYIQWLDADNLLAPDKIYLQIKYASDDGMLLSSSWGRFYYRAKKAIFSPTSLWTDLDPPEWIYRKVNEDIFIVPECWLISRGLTERAGPWNEKLSLDDDGEYFTRLITNCEKIKFVSEARSYYRSGNPGSLSSVFRRPEEKLESQYSAICSQISYLLSLEDNARTRKACLKFLQGNLILFYPERINIVERARKLAQELGGTLSVPDLRWKYSLLKPIFGWSVSKDMQFKMPALKEMLRTKYDKLLYELQEKKDTGRP